MKKIMIVDDEPDLRNMLNLLLQNEGFEIGEANDGTDFLNKIDAFEPNLVLLDVMMPGLSIEETLQKLQKKRSKPKIILLTVIRYSKDEIKNIFKMGNIVEYVKKPFELSNLVETIKTHI